MESWKEFMKLEKHIIHDLRTSDNKFHCQSLDVIDIIGQKTGFPLTFQIGMNLRNGKKLPERKNTVELIISPNWDRSKIPLVEKLYDASKKADLPEYWSIIKYQVCSPSVVFDMNIEGITHEDFSYCVQFNFEGKSAWIGVLVFVDDKLAKKILKKESDDKWILNTTTIKGRAPLIFLNSAAGEYNMITRIKAVEFVPSSFHRTVPQYSLIELHKEFEKMDNQKYSNNKDDIVNKCIRCDIHSYQTDLFSCDKCKKIYYCSKTCQKGDKKNHKYVC